MEYDLRNHCVDIDQHYNTTLIGREENYNEIINNVPKILAGKGYYNLKVETKPYTRSFYSFHTKKLISRDLYYSSRSKSKASNMSGLESRSSSLS